MKKLCFNLFVVSEKKEVVVGMKVSESTKRLLDKIVEENDRTVSYVARELMLRGLNLYQKDGLLRDREVEYRTEQVPVLKRKAR